MHARNDWRHPVRLRARRGAILVLVLVVIVLLTLATYNYTQLMMTELEAASVHGSDVQARMLADSGAEYIATVLQNRSIDGIENLQNNPTMFAGVGVIDSERARARGRFTIIAPLEQDSAATQVRYGLMDESARLNLNLLDKLKLDDEQSRTLLMGLPNMTYDIADAIRDWIDTDDTSRQYGAESEYYESLAPPYTAKNGPLESIDELLLVKGVTAELLYGEDANRNGLLDPNENDGDATPPLDNADGVLQHGWITYLTTHSREANVRTDGTTKIDVNNGVLADLYDQLAEEFDEATAEFVVAYRMFGPMDTDPAKATTSGNGTTSGSGSSGSGSGSKSGGSGSGGSGSGSGSGSGGSGKGGSGSGSGSSGGSGSPGSGSSGGGSSGGGSSGGGTGGANFLKNLAAGGQVTRGRLDLTAGAKYQVASLWELIGSRTNATIIGGSKVEISSPWTADGGSLQTSLPTLIDKLGLSSETYVEGRININQARREVLVGLPKMTEQIVDAIIAGQPGADGQMGDTLGLKSTTGWLFSENIVTDIWTMRELDKYITARGDVYRAQILGFFDGGGPVARTEVIIDGTELPPRIVFQRDLDDLGRGYTRIQMFPNQDQ